MLEVELENSNFPYNQQIQKDLIEIVNNTSKRGITSKLKGNKVVWSYLNKLSVELNIERKVIVYLLYKNISPQEALCPICNNKPKGFISLFEGLYKTCSDKCSRFLDRYSVAKENNLKKYGVEHPMKLEKVVQKGKETQLKKFGVEHYCKLSKVKEKIKEKASGRSNKEKKEIIKKAKKTSLKKYGVEHFSQLPEQRKKKKNSRQTELLKTYCKKYNIKEMKRTYQSFNQVLQGQVIKIPSYEEYINCGATLGHFSLLCKKCLRTFQTTYHFVYLRKNNKTKELNIICPYCNPRSVSSSEIEVGDFIENILSIKVERNNRSLLSKNRELDIFIPDKKIGVEYNGIMFHSIGRSPSSIFNNVEEESRVSLSHLQKTEECLEKGIQLLHIFSNEREQVNKQKIWKSIISSKLGIYEKKYFARKLIVQKVGVEESKKFLEENHLQGSVNSSIKLGLYQDNGKGRLELLQLMTFGRSRFSKKYDYELHRLCSKKNTLIIGGSSKLFSHFKKNYLKSGEKVISYSDRRYSKGDIYEKLGFKFSHKTNPNYFYFNSNKDINSIELESRIKYQKHKLKDLFKNYNEELTEKEILYSNGYRRIYDSGNLVFLYLKV